MGFDEWQEILNDLGNLDESILVEFEQRMENQFRFEFRVEEESLSFDHHQNILQKTLEAFYDRFPACIVNPYINQLEKYQSILEIENVQILELINCCCDGIALKREQLMRNLNSYYFAQNLVKIADFSILRLFELQNRFKS